MADRIVRLAFGTFVGAPEPEQFWSDLDYARTGWLVDPTAAFGAELDEELVGSNFASKWGSVGFFGPLTVRPDLWDRGIGTRLLDPIMECFATWGIQHAGLFPFAHSPKHLGLYQKYGFWLRFLTATMSKPVPRGESSAPWATYGELPEHGQEDCLSACRELTDMIYAGLDAAERLDRVMYRVIDADGLLSP